MFIERMKSKIHRVRVTEANLNYVGSITIDEDLMDAANMIAGEKVAIVDNNSGTACGFLDVTDLDAIHRRAQIGIVLLPEAQGKGIATKALDEAAMYALQQGLHQLFAVVASDNLKARKLFLRSSYLETTVLPQWLYVDGKFTDAILYQRILEK